MARKITDGYLREKVKILKKSALKHQSDMRPGRRRVWLHGYLTDVFRIFLEFRSRRFAKSATRRMAKMFNLPLGKKSHPVRVLIEASAGREDSRAKSRWTQALRYAYKCRVATRELDGFFKRNKGVAGCAAKFATPRADRNSEKLLKNGSSSDQPDAQGDVLRQPVSQTPNNSAVSGSDVHTLHSNPGAETVGTKITDKYLIAKIEVLRRAADNIELYPYLQVVYEVFLDLKSKGMAKKIARQIVKSFDLPIKRKSHLLRALIEASSTRQTNRTKSEWADALRYAYGWLQRPERLEWFFGVNDGIAGSAAKFAFLEASRRQNKPQKETCSADLARAQGDPLPRQ